MLRGELNDHQQLLSIHMRAQCSHDDCISAHTCELSVIFLHCCRSGDSAPDFAYGDLLTEDARYTCTLGITATLHATSCWPPLQHALCFHCLL